MKQIPNYLFFAWVEEELAHGREVRIQVKGTSMTPFLRDGMDDVVIVPCSASELALLDVVLFRYRGKHVMHRLVRLQGDVCTLQGDGVWASQEHCWTSDIIGRVKQVCRPGKSPFSVKSGCWVFLSLVWHMCRPVRRWLLALLYRVSPKSQ